MPRITGVDWDQLADHRELFELIGETYGFVPNSFRTLGRNSALLAAAGRLGNIVMIDAQHTSLELRWLVAHVSSRAAGCAYCAAHSALYASRVGGASVEKVREVWEFETSELFTEAERAALRLAWAAGLAPNQATDAHFEALAEHFSEEAILELVAVIALFGFFNRWNDTLATDLESVPAAFRERARPQAADG
jgi:uncharacterized peroxidase-related enzyme